MTARSAPVIAGEVKRIICIYFFHKKGIKEKKRKLFVRNLCRKINKKKMMSHKKNYLILSTQIRKVPRELTVSEKEMGLYKTKAYLWMTNKRNRRKYNFYR